MNFYQKYILLIHAVCLQLNCINKAFQGYICKPERFFLMNLGLWYEYFVTILVELRSYLGGIRKRLQVEVNNKRTILKNLNYR